MNQLENEKSPYLQQHAGNPVDWYPWGDEAFEKAKLENKPIFLSIGYSTCHWCHVMAHESFEDPEVARLLNETFVSIKVDREERPDIDSLYMSVCQMLTGRGGWPMTILMTPDKKPFFAGTYFPKTSRFNIVGLTELIPRIKNLWETQSGEIANSANEIVKNLQEAVVIEPGELTPEVLETAFSQLDQRFDEGYGGFGHAPKFPTPHNFYFLLRYWKRTGNKRALRMVEKTLQTMRLGGIYDQIGFGFHRYSVDREWVVPHFEKMLYDQALLAIGYTETYLATGNEEYHITVDEIFTYLTRNMRDSGGGFYSSEDADSEGVEGKFYVWTESEIDSILTPEEAALAKKAFSVKSQGNFQEEASGQSHGTNILMRSEPANLQAGLQFAGERVERAEGALHLQEPASSEALKKIGEKLFQAREKRIHPHKDKKILTDWNGLLIAAFSKAGRTFGNPEYARTAQNILNFIETSLTKNNRLLHRYYDGEAAIPAFLDDYAFLIWGLIELYEATFDIQCLEKALKYQAVLFEHFLDKENGGFFFTADDAEQVLIRTKDLYDGALPSGNSIALYNLLRLARMTARTDLEEKARQMIRAFSMLVLHAPAGYTQFLSAYDFVLSSGETVIIGEQTHPNTKGLIQQFANRFDPNNVILYASPSELSKLAAYAPWVHDLKSIDGKPTVFQCVNRRCSLPITDPNSVLTVEKN